MLILMSIIWLHFTSPLLLSFNNFLKHQYNLRAINLYWVLRMYVIPAQTSIIHDRGRYWISILQGIIQFPSIFLSTREYYNVMTALKGHR